MHSRRSVLGLATTLVGGGLFAGTPVQARTATSTDHHHDAGNPLDDPVRTANASSRSIEAPITVAGSIDPSVLRVTGLPEPLAAVFARERDRYRSLSIDDVDAVGGRATLRGPTPVAGRVAAAGSFDPRAIAADLDRHEREFVAVEAGNDDVENDEVGTDARDRAGARREPARRFVGAGGRYAIGISASTVRIGYGLDTEWALEEDRSPPAQSVAAASSEATGAAARLRSVLSGDAVGYAALSPGGRERVAAELPPEADALAAAIRSASAIGAAMRAGPERTRLRYGLVASGVGPDPETVEELVTAARAEASAHDVALHRGNRTFVLDATVDTDAIWSAHRRGMDELAD